MQDIPIKSIREAHMTPSENRVMLNRYNGPVVKVNHPRIVQVELSGYDNHPGGRGKSNCGVAVVVKSKNFGPRQKIYDVYDIPVADNGPGNKDSKIFLSGTRVFKGIVKNSADSWLVPTGDGTEVTKAEKARLKILLTAVAPHFGLGRYVMHPIK